MRLSGCGSHVKRFVLACGIAVLAFSFGLRAQMAQQAGAAKAPAVSVPAPSTTYRASGTCAPLPPTQVPRSTYTQEGLR